MHAFNLFFIGVAVFDFFYAAVVSKKVDGINF